MNKNKKIIVIIIVLICSIFYKINVQANELKSSSPENLAVTLVIDTSGSMATTDPKKLRETAANIFIDLLSPDDYLSIITFNTKEEVVIPMQKIQSSDNKAAFKIILSQKLQAIGDTDYVLALNEASKQLNSVNEGNIRKVILFLTDGKPDPNNKKKNDPTFMNSYMDSLWNTVSNLALNKYAVYSVGFSKDVDSAVLERISSSTQGAVKISNDSSELALSFFDILGNLKNRNGFLNKTFELKGGDSFEFDLDEYTSQTTMVFTNPDGASFDVTISSTDGKGSKDAVTVNKSDKYSIVTVNQKNEKFTGKWTVNLKGDGSIKAFGSKDLFVKSWLVNPQPSSIHPLNEPLEISVNVTGEVKDNISVEAYVTKEGAQDPTPIKLAIKDGVFAGIYNKIDKVGKYDIETRLMLNEQVISKTNTSFFVRELPLISTDFLEKDTSYRLGDKLSVTSSLKMADNKQLLSSELKIENYNLILNYANSGTETISLLDNGSADYGDIKENDLLWSNKVSFNKEDSGKASIIVNGIYKGEKFLIEKSLGNFKICAPGKLLIKPLSNKQLISFNNEFKIPIEIENTSNFTETLIINVDKSIGQLAQDRIKIEALKKLETYIYINIDKKSENKVNDIIVKMSTEDTRTIVEPAEFNTQVKMLSKVEYLWKFLRENSKIIIILLGSCVGMLLLIILSGSILYRLLVYKNRIIQGKILYWRETDIEAQDKKEFDFNKLGMGKIIISFNEESRSAQFHIPCSKYNYDIELIAIVQKSRWKFVDGFKAIFHRNNSSELLLKTTQPGIFIYEGKIFTSKKIYKNDKFITGEYVFQFVINEKVESKDRDKGRNVLREL